LLRREIATLPRSGGVGAVEKKGLRASPNSDSADSTIDQAGGVGQTAKALGLTVPDNRSNKPHRIVTGPIGAFVMAITPSYPASMRLLRVAEG